MSRRGRASLRKRHCHNQEYTTGFLKIKERASHENKLLNGSADPSLTFLGAKPGFIE